MGRDVADGVVGGVSAPLRSGRVLSVCVSADGERIAIATAHRGIVTLYDGGGNRVDRFGTKPNKAAKGGGGGGTGYIVR